jgi:hypothetical protein
MNIVLWAWPENKAVALQWLHSSHKHDSQQVALSVCQPSRGELNHATSKGNGLVFRDAVH